MIRRTFMQMISGLVGAGFLTWSATPRYRTPCEIVLRGLVSRGCVNQWANAVSTRNATDRLGFAAGSMTIVRWGMQPVDNGEYEATFHLAPFRPMKVVDLTGEVVLIDSWQPAHEWPSFDGFTEVRDA